MKKAGSGHGQAYWQQHSSAPHRGKTCPSFVSNRITNAREDLQREPTSLYCLAKHLIGATTGLEAKLCRTLLGDLLGSLILILTLLYVAILL